MATATGNYVSDNSSFANFANWATAIGQALLTFGWKQSADTGQIQWLGCSISACSMSGSNATYTYSGLTTSGNATAFRVGQAVTITGFTGGNTGCNGTFVITAVGAGTFTVVNASGTNNSGATAVITKQTTAPSSSYLGEIWTAQDAQAATLPIYAKLEYGYSSTSPGFRLTFGTGSNGSGTISNILTGYNGNTFTTMANMGATTYPCYFSGDSGEFRMLMWATKNNNDQVVMVIERSKDNSGNKTADYWTVIVGSQGGSARQQTCTGVSTQIAWENWPVAVITGGVNRGTAYWNGTVAASPIFPLLGSIGNPMLGLMVCVAADVADNTLVTVSTLYGSTHTYIVTKGGTAIGIKGIGQCFSSANTNACLMRYE